MLQGGLLLTGSWLYTYTIPLYTLLTPFVDLEPLLTAIGDSATTGTDIASAFQRHSTLHYKYGRS